MFVFLDTFGLSRTGASGHVGSVYPRKINGKYNQKTEDEKWFERLVVIESRLQTSRNDPQHLLNMSQSQKRCQQLPKTKTSQACPNNLPNMSETRPRNLPNMSQTLPEDVSKTNTLLHCGLWVKDFSGNDLKNGFYVSPLNYQDVDVSNVFWKKSKRLGLINWFEGPGRFRKVGET